MNTGSVERIAHYKILKRVGRGGMGIVYRAVDERDGRAVALKVIREAEASGDESAPHVNEARERFQREAAILEGLLHVNIVSFYEIGEEDGTPYLAMEFLDGSSLTSFAGRPFPETLPLLVQAAHGMECLASRGIVHRDLSPDNILVVESGGERIVKLLDFGIAKLFEAPAGRESLTATGFFLGKVAYGSPEQLGSIGQGAALDWRSDVYSLGVIFYQVLAGRRPFEGKAPVEFIAAHLNQPAPPVASPPGTPALPMELVRLVAQMLEKRREDRPKSYREVIDTLVGVLRQSGRVAERSEPQDRARDVAYPTSPTELVGGAPAAVVPLPISDRPLARAALGVVLLAMMLSLVVFFTLRPGGKDPRAQLPLGAGAAPAGTFTSPGTLQVVATPFARIMSITESGTGRVVPLEKDATTPRLVSPLVPGSYRVVLTCQSLQQTVTREVIVGSGSSVLLSQSFLEPVALLELLR